MPKTLAATRHFKLAQALRGQIARMRVGDALATVLEMRQQFDCSQATVERALDRLRREGLIVRPPGQLRWTVAQASDPATHRVAIIRPDYPSPTFEELTRVIIESGKRKDWRFETETYRHINSVDLNRALGDVDGAVLLPSSEAFPEYLMNALRRPRKPVVIIQDPPRGLHVSSVRIDDEQIARLAVDHLVSLGHTRILLLLSEPPAPSGNLRAAGWRSAMEAIGQADLDSLVVNPELKPFDNTLLKTYEHFSGYLKREHAPFSAVFCPAWTGAVAALRALREAGLSVPEQVSVVAHGGEGYIAPFLFPALTSVETDIARYGDKIIEVLENQLHGSREIQTLTVESQLVRRQSTAPARAEPA